MVLTWMEPLICPRTCRPTPHTMQESLTSEGQHCLAILYCMCLATQTVCWSQLSICSWGASENTHGHCSDPACSTLILSYLGELPDSPSSEGQRAWLLLLIKRWFWSASCLIIALERLRQEDCCKSKASLVSNKQKKITSYGSVKYQHSFLSLHN